MLPASTRKWRAGGRCLQLALKALARFSIRTKTLKLPLHNNRTRYIGKMRPMKLNHIASDAIHAIAVNMAAIREATPGS